MARRSTAVCVEVESDLRGGLHAVVVADYEFGRNLQLAQPGDAALRFLLFRECAHLSRDEADAWLASQDDGAARPSAAGVAGMKASVTRDEFDAAIAAVHEALHAGDSYQVNYTYRLTFDVFGTPFALYRRLRERQPVRYGALIALPEGGAVVSCSPELFIEKRGDLLRARPMKGTAPRDTDPQVAPRRSEESRRKRDDRRLAAQRHVARGCHRDRAGARAFFRRAVCIRVADDIDHRGARAPRHHVRGHRARAVSVRLDHRRARNTRRCS